MRYLYHLIISLTLVYIASSTTPWSYPKPVSNSTESVNYVKCSPIKLIWVVIWTQNEKNSKYSTSVDGINWYPEMPLNSVLTSTPYFVNPVFCVSDNTGYTVVVWVSDIANNNDTQPITIQSAFSENKGWSFLTVSSSTDPRGSVPSISSSVQGRWLVTWTGANYSVLVSSALSSTSLVWSFPLVLNSGINNNPQGKFSGGIWVVLWEYISINGSSIVYKYSLDEISWSSLCTLVPPGIYTNSLPSIVSDEAKHWIVTWRQDSSTTTSIMVAATANITNPNLWHISELSKMQLPWEGSPTVDPSIMADITGNVLVVWHTNQLGLGTDFDVVTRHSGDYGITWDPLQYINDDAFVDTYNDVLPSVSRLGRDWLIVWISDRRDGTVYSSVCTNCTFTGNFVPNPIPTPSPTSTPIWMAVPTSEPTSPTLNTTPTTTPEVVPNFLNVTSWVVTQPDIVRVPISDSVYEPNPMTSLVPEKDISWFIWQGDRLVSGDVSIFKDYYRIDGNLSVSSHTLYLNNSVLNVSGNCYVNSSLVVGYSTLFVSGSLHFYDQSKLFIINSTIHIQECVQLNGILVLSVRDTSSPITVLSSLSNCIKGTFSKVTVNPSLECQVPVTNYQKDIVLVSFDISKECSSHTLLGQPMLIAALVLGILLLLVILGLLVIWVSGIYKRTLQKRRAKSLDQLERRLAKVSLEIGLGDTHSAAGPPPSAQGGPTNPPVVKKSSKLKSFFSFRKEPLADYTSDPVTVSELEAYEVEMKQNAEQNTPPQSPVIDASTK